jgi:UDP-N-acetylglucosamine/UDP-N-acetylgalactosamine diphosphorylase
LGPDVELKGGFFCNSVFLEKSGMGSCAHVRDACILEEEANGAHTVGLKHTILFPFVTLGSLINFCDCLMAGGTSRKNHSEVGSSYIHFNYTPNQDKITPSLIGDVHRGVMLDQPPIFLGGQGGLVGPAKLGFGTVIAAGAIFRGDFLEENKFFTGAILKEKYSDFYPGLYWTIHRQILNNINYIANLIALSFWYKEIRSQFLKESPMGKELYKGALEKLNIAIHERIKHFKAFVQKLPGSIKIYQEIRKENASEQLISQKRELFDKWSQIEGIFSAFRENDMESAEKILFLEKIDTAREKMGNDYIRVIKGLDKNCREMGSKWLKSIVDRTNEEVLGIIPSLKI